MLIFNVQVHLPVDNKTQVSKGFVYVQFKSSLGAVEAFKELDRKGFQGRLLHIIPAAPKRETKLNEFEISKLPLKKQRELKRKASAATSQFNWNSMYMNVIKPISALHEPKYWPRANVFMVGRCCDVLRSP
jgi:multiple RNA-binding domain-containing protein 1